MLATDQSHLELIAFDGESGKVLNVWSVSAGQVLQIGRHPENDMVLAHPKISRFHATIFFDGHHWHCACFGSNLMVVKGQEVNHATMRDQGTLELVPGGPRLAFEIENDESERGMGSISVLIHDMKVGNHDSANQLWQRCFSTIVRLAHQRLGTTPKRVADEEDVAVSVFESLFFRGVEGKLPELSDRDSLWRLLVVITSRKAANAINHERRQKRGGGQVRGDSIGDVRNMKGGSVAGNAFDRFVSEMPTPESIALLEEQTAKWLDLLPDTEHRTTAMLRLEGHSNEEISDALDCSLRTVERRLQKIREVWTTASVEPNWEEDTVIDNR